MCWVPLALAFVGLMCVPGLWEIIEYLSPLELIVFLPIAIVLQFTMIWLVFKLNAKHACDTDAQGTVVLAE